MVTSLCPVITHTIIGYQSCNYGEFSHGMSSEKRWCVMKSINHRMLALAEFMVISRRKIIIHDVFSPYLSLHILIDLKNERRLRNWRGKSKRGNSATAK